MFVAISSPSGCGKTTIAKAIAEKIENAVLSISHTTRSIRNKEIDGIDYHFVKKDDFLSNKEKFIEYTQIFDNYYGTSIENVNLAKNNSQILLFDIDYAGVQSLKTKLQDDIITIFILPPSIHELRSRLANRCGHSDEEINTRINGAYQELQTSIYYDYIIVNNDLENAIAETEAIIKSELKKCYRMKNLEQIISGLRSELVNLQQN